MAVSLWITISKKKLGEIWEATLKIVGNEKTEFDYLIACFLLEAYKMSEHRYTAGVPM